MALGRYTEAETTLLPNNEAESIPNGAAGIYLLGKIYQLTNRHTAAITNFRNALHMDPMLWCAFEELCSLGAEKECAQYLDADPGVLSQSLAGHTVYDDRDGVCATPTVLPVTGAPPTVGVTPEGEPGIRVPGTRRKGVQWTTTTTAAASAARRSISSIQSPALSGAVGTPIDTPDVGIQALAPPPVKRDVKAPPDSWEDIGSPSVLGDKPFFSGRKFLDEGTMRKVRNFSVLIVACKVICANQSSLDCRFPVNCFLTLQVQ